MLFWKYFPSYISTRNGRMGRRKINGKEADENGRELESYTYYWYFTLAMKTIQCIFGILEITFLNISHIILHRHRYKWPISKLSYNLDYIYILLRYCPPPSPLPSSLINFLFSSACMVLHAMLSQKCLFCLKDLAKNGTLLCFIYWWN